MKVMCNHAGGTECKGCGHNEPHLPVTYRTGPKCIEPGILCPTALNHCDGSDYVVCRKLEDL